MPPVLHMVIALLIGVYIGINLSSGVHFHSYPPSPLDGHEDVRLHGTHNDVRKAQSEALLWQKRAHKAEEDYAQATERIRGLEAAGVSTDKTENCKDQAMTMTQQRQTSTRIPHRTNSHALCQQLPIPIPTATALWHSYLSKILQATRLPNDRKYQFHDFTAELLHIISPRLPRSIKSLPHDWSSLENALDVAWNRYQYLQLSPAERRQRYPTDTTATTPPPRPLKILVMGGSLLVGTNCRKLLTEFGLGFRLPKRDCTWSNRLGQFINALLLGGNEDGNDENDDEHRLVEVTKVAMGGTNTATGQVILAYDLIPQEARQPDIILNAYSTNDMHILTILEAQSANTTLRDKVFDMTQSFIRQVLEGCSATTKPLLLHMDDYLGNEQRTIWETTELAQGVQVLASYYGFTSMSYADVVRDFVYGDTYESWFSANWWEKGRFEREIHPGMGMHIASTWVVVYGLLHLTTTFCSLPVPNINDIFEYNTNEANKMGLPPLRKDLPQAKGKPKRPPKGMPPILTKELLIENVTALWKQAEHAATCKTTPIVRGQQRYKPERVKCPFSWVSGLSLQQNNQTWIQEYFQQYASRWEGWKLSDDGGKIGFIPTKQTDSYMVLDFPNVAQPLNTVTFFIMKSYGDKWRNSRLQVSTFESSSDGDNTSKRNWKQLTSREMVGFHNKNTSEMYTESIPLSESIPKGASLRVAAHLVDGTSFKLMGLAICS